MKLFFIFIVSVCIQAHSVYCHGQRIKRQERWTWSNTNDDTTDLRITSTKLKTTTSTSTTTEVPSEKAREDANPCIKRKPRPPNFNKPGRRISDVKCYEYIWNRIFREEEDDRENKCLIRNAALIGSLIPIGGYAAFVGEFPHMGAVGWKSKNGTWIFKCGSTLISPKFMLTAAHCTRTSDSDTSVSDPVPKIVRLGDRNILDEYSNNVSPHDEEILKIIKHPRYASPSKYNDIALFELKNEVKFTDLIQPACLWTKKDVSQLGKVAHITGWGVVETASRKTATTLTAVVVDLIDTKTCDNLLKPYCSKYWCGVQDHQMCAGKLKGGADSCQGDSGGPLSVKIKLPKEDVHGVMSYIVGVTSFGVGCALENTPGVYSRVSAYLDWIENIVWP